MLLLFDIDGTLLRCGGAGRRAFEGAFEILFGVAGAMEGIEFAGNTDPVIVEQAVAQASLEDPSEAQLDRFYELYLGRLEQELASGPGFELMRGATRLAQALDAGGRHVLGLATGNVERGARLKLGRAELNAYFGFGGFGSDARLRADLVRRGIARGQARAERELGARLPPEEIFVLGDTVHDVRAAREAGAVAVGVLAGAHHPEALIDSSPDLLVESLEDPRLWSALGL